MAAPSSYTETSLAEYAHVTVRDLAEKAGWTPQDGFYTEVINETLLALGVADVTTISGDTAIRALRAVTRRETWKALLASLASKHDFSTDAQSFKRNQMFDAAKTLFLMADTDCAALGVDSAASTITISPMIYVHDPYVPLTNVDPDVVYQAWP